MPPALAAVVVLVALLFGAQGAGFWLLRDRGPTGAEHARAAAYLRSHHQPGDVIFLAPPYATEAREHLGDLQPLAVAAPAREDLTEKDRAWVYALFGAEEEVAAALERAGHRRLERRRFEGGIVVDRYALWGPRAEVSWRLVDALPSARVTLEHPDGRREGCARWEEASFRGGPGGRWVCPRDSDWLYVGPEWHRMGDHLRRCLWAHPPRTGRLVIEVSGVPLSETLAGVGGHTLMSRKRAKAPVFLDVKVGDADGQRFVFGLEDTWRPFRMATPSAGTTTVSFAVSSPDNGANHFCFLADTRRLEPRGEKR